MKSTVFATALVLTGAAFASAAAPARSQGLTPDPTPTHILMECPLGRECRPYGGSKAKPMSYTACAMDATGVRYVVPESTVITCMPIRGKV